MLQTLNHIFLQFLQFSKENPIIAGGLGLWGLSVLTFFLRDVPSTIKSFIVRQSTTTLDLNSQDRVYHDFLIWLSKNKMHKLVRSVNINNGVYFGGYHRVSLGLSPITFGYGKTFFFHKRRLFFIYRSKEAANNSDLVKETLSLSLLGRSHKVLQNLFDEIKQAKEDTSEYTEINKYSGGEGGWHETCRVFKRNPSSVIIQKDIENKLYSTIDKFLSSKEWYKKNGVPYRMGILLYGPAGTGKTSLIKAICAKYDRALYTLSLNSINDEKFLDAMASLPPKCVVAIEDIDAFGVNVNRDSESSGKEKMLGLTMSGLLNGIDGVASAENRILICTTNHLDRLDAALVRDGRFDLKLHIGNMDLDSINRYLGGRYENFKPLDETIPVDLISPAHLQRLVFENQDDYKPVVEAIRNLKNKEVENGK